MMKVDYFKNNRPMTRHILTYLSFQYEHRNHRKSQFRAIDEVENYFPNL